MRRHPSACPHHGCQGMGKPAAQGCRGLVSQGTEAGDGAHDQGMVYGVRVLRSSPHTIFISAECKHFLATVSPFGEKTAKRRPLDSVLARLPAQMRKLIAIPDRARSLIRLRPWFPLGGVARLTCFHQGSDGTPPCHAAALRILGDPWWQPLPARLSIATMAKRLGTNRDASSCN